LIDFIYINRCPFPRTILHTQGHIHQSGWSGFSIVTIDYKIRVLALQVYLPTTEKIINQTDYANTTLWSNLMWHKLMFQQFTMVSRWAMSMIGNRLNKRKQTARVTVLLLDPSSVLMVGC